MCVTHKTRFVYNTALHLSIFKGHMQAVEQLLKFGTDINQKNNKQATSLMIAIAAHNINIVKLLLAYALDLGNIPEIYEASIEAIQIEIHNYKCDPVLYILKHNHEVPQCLRALNNIELYNQYSGLQNITAFKECINELDNHKSYLNLLQLCDTINNEENDYILQGCGRYYD